jgi:hypothetical protein
MEAACRHKCHGRVVLGVRRSAHRRRERAVVLGDPRCAHRRERAVVLGDPRCADSAGAAGCLASRLAGVTLADYITGFC